MKNQSATFRIVFALLILAALWVRLPGPSIALAEQPQPPEAASLAGATLYLPLVMGGSGSGGGSGGGGGSGSGFVWLPFTLQDGSLLPTYGASTAVDAQGGIHVVYALYSGTDDQGQQPATYAFCSSGCEDRASWSFTRLGEAVQDARIALDQHGRPRLILFGPTYDPTWPRMRYQYAACNAGCTNPANWTITTIATPIEPTATREYNNNHYFALDSQGRPAFIYTDTIQNNHPGTFYMSCQANCTDASQWTETTLTTGALFDKVSLAFAPGGQPRLAFGFTDANGDLYLSYAACEANCTDGANWPGTTLVQIHGSAKFNLALDSSGRPRLGVYSGSYAYNPFHR